MPTTKKKPLPDRGSVEKATEAAAAVVTQGLPDKRKAKSMMIPVRMNEIDYKRLMGLFGSQGVPLARAGSLALYYVAEQLEAGRLSVSRAGIIDRRG